MKRSPKRLHLSRETLRTLDHRNLATANGAGGASSGPCHAVDTWFYLPSNFCVREPATSLLGCDGDR